MTHAELICPNCGSDRVIITDHEPLATNSGDIPVDTEIYVSLICGYCEHTFNTVGEITYKQPQLLPQLQPQPKLKKVSFILTVNVDTDVNLVQYMENVIEAMKHSDNVQSVTENFDYTNIGVNPATNNNALHWWDNLGTNGIIRIMVQSELTKKYYGNRKVSSLTDAEINTIYKSEKF